MHNAELIRVAMARKQMTGEQLATKAGLSRPTVTRIVHGKTVMPDKLKAAADVLGLSMAELFTSMPKQEEAPVAKVA